MATGEWFADESFWTGLYPFLFTPERLAEANQEADAVLALVGDQPATLLDLCCGPGRHSVALATRGIRVTAVDRSAFLLARAREHAASERVEAEWIQADMREFARPAAFDAAVNLFTSFGYFDEPGENAAVLANVFASRKPGGTFVIDVVGKEVVARVFEPIGTEEVPGVASLVQRRRIVDDWCRIENEWIMTQAGVVRTFRFRHWLYSGRELRDLLAAAGFDPVRLFGGLHGEPYGPEAKRLVAVGRKPAPEAGDARPLA